MQLFLKIFHIIGTKNTKVRGLTKKFLFYIVNLSQSEISTPLT